jgi:hypothetical protein
MFALIRVGKTKAKSRVNSHHSVTVFGEECKSRGTERRSGVRASERISRSVTRAPPPCIDSLTPLQSRHVMATTQIL